MKASQPLQLIRSASIALVLLLISGVSLAQAQTIFVNSTGGSDSNSGTTAGAPKLTVFGANGALSAVAANGTISVANSGASYGSGTINKVITLTSTGGTAQFGVLTFTSNTAISGPINASFVINGATVTGGGNITVPTGGSMVRTLGSIDVAPVLAGTSTLQYNGAANLTTGPEFVATGVSDLSVNITGPSTLTIDGSKTITGVLDVDATQTLALGSNTLTLAAGITSPNHDVDGTVTTAAGGLLAVTGTTGTPVFTASAGVLGNLSMNTSNTVLGGTISQVGDITLASGGATFTGLSNVASVTGSVVNSGSGDLTLNNPGATAFGIAGSVTNSANGQILIPVDDAVTVGGNVLNSGALSNTSAVQIANDANITFGTSTTAITGTTTNSVSFAGSLSGAAGGFVTSGNINFPAAGANGSTFTGLVTNSASSTFDASGADNIADFNDVGQITVATVTGTTSFNGGVTLSTTGFADTDADGGGGGPFTPDNGGFVFSARAAGNVTVVGNMTNSTTSTGASGEMNFNAAATGGTVTAGTIINSGTGDADIVFGIEIINATATNQTSTNAGSSIDINSTLVAFPVSLGAVTLSGEGTIDVSALTTGALTTGAYNQSGNTTFNAGALTTGNTNFNGTFTQTGGTLNMSAITTGTVTFAAAFSQSGGNTTIAAATSSGAKAFSSTFSLSSGTLIINGAAANDISVAGDFSMTGGTLNLGANARNLFLTGASNTLSGGTAVGAAADLEFNRAISTQSLTSGANVTWPGNVVIANGFPNGPVWSLLGNHLNVGGNVTFGATSTGYTADLGAFTINMTGAGTFTNTGAAGPAGGYTCSATTGKVRMAGGGTVTGTGRFCNLEIDGGNVAVGAGGITVENEVRLTVGSFTGNAVTVDSGTVIRGQGSFGVVPTYTNGVAVRYTTTVGPNVAAGAGNELPPAGTITDVTLDFSGTATTLQLSDDFSMTGVLTIPTGQSLDVQGCQLTTGTSAALAGSVTDGGGDGDGGGGNCVANAGSLELTRATGTAISGAGNLIDVNVANASAGNSITGNPQLVGSLTMTGGATASNITLAFGTDPGTGNISGNLATVGANSTTSLGANATVGGNLLHGNGLISLGAFNLTVGTTGATPAHTYGPNATLTGTGTLTFDDNGAAGVSTLTPTADGGTIAAPVVIALFDAADTFTMAGGFDFTFGNVSVTNGVLVGNGAAGLTTFNGTAVTLAGPSDLNSGAGGMLFAPASGTLTVTGETYLGNVYSTNGDVVFAPRVPATPTPTVFPGNLTQVAGTLTFGGPATVTGTFTQTAGTTTLGGATTVTAGIVQTAGDIAIGTNNLTSTGNYTRTAGTITGTTGTFIFNGATFTAGATSLAVPNLTLSSALVQSFASDTDVTVGGTLTLANTNAGATTIDVAPVATSRLHLAANGNVIYTQGALDLPIIYDGAIAVMTSAINANRTIPAAVWPASATVNLFRVSGGGFTTAMPGDRTVQDEIHLNSGLLDLDNDAGVAGGNANTDLTIANSTLRVTAGTIEAGAGAPNTGGDLLFTNPPTVIYETNAAAATGEELDNATTVAALTFTRSTNVANSARTLNTTVTVNGQLNVLNNVTLTAGINVVSDFTVTNDVANFAAATAPVFAGAGAVSFNGTAPQTFSGAALGGNVTVANSTTFTGATTVAGTLTINAPLTTSGALTANGATVVNAATSLATGSTVGGTMTINNADVTAGGTLTFTGGANADLTFAGTGKIVGTGPLVLVQSTTANQGFTRGLASTALGGCSVVPVRKNIPIIAGANPTPMRVSFPLCNATGNYRPNAITFNDTRVLTAGNTMTVQLFDNTPPLPNPPPAAPAPPVNGVPFSVTSGGDTWNIARFAPFYWLVTMGFDEVPSVAYDVELRAAGYAAFDGELIQRVRNIRQINGAATNFWNAVSQTSTNDNFAVSSTEPVGISRGAVGLLATQGTLFTLGLESNLDVATTIADKTLNAGTSDATTNLATTFSGGTAPYSYAVTSSDAAIATGSVTGTVLTVNGVAGGGPATLTVTITDAVGDTQSTSFQVTVNPALTAAAIPAVTLNPTQTSTVDLTTVFSDGAAPYTYSVVDSDAAVATGSISGTTLTITAVGAGSATVTVTATDALGSTAPAPVSVTVNAALAAGTLPNITVTQGTADATTNTAATFTGGDGTYTVTVGSGATSVATVSYSADVVTVNGLAAYQGDFTDTAPVVITVAAEDGLGSQASTTFTADVIAVKGDVDGDGAVTVFDAGLVLDFAVSIGAPAPGSKRFVAADWNGSGVIQAFDAFEIYNTTLAPKARKEISENVVADLNWGEVLRTQATVDLPVALTGDINGAVAAQLWTKIDPAVAKVVGVTFLMQDAIASTYNVTDEGDLSLAVIGGIVPSDGIIASISLELLDASTEFEIAARGAVNNNAAADIDALEVLELPEAFALLGNYPNPFNPSTNIQFDLPASSEVSIEVYDMLGRRVMVVPAQTIQAGAKRSLQINASALASGSYFYRVIAKAESSVMVDSGRMLLVK